MNADSRAESSRHASTAVYLRVKRHRNESNEESVGGPGNTVTVRCCDVVHLTTSTTSQAFDPDASKIQRGDSVASLPTRKYVFVRLVKDQDAPPPAVGSTCSNDTAEATKDIKGDDSQNQNTARDAAAAADVEEALKELTINLDARETHGDIHQRNVKALPTSAQISQDSRNRSFQRAHNSRRALRCDRIGKLRRTDGDAICIDASLVADTFAPTVMDDDGDNVARPARDDDEEAAAYVYDLYVLEASHSASTSSDGVMSSSAPTSGDEADEEDDVEAAVLMQFDDEDDEFSFNWKSQGEAAEAARRRIMDRFRKAQRRRLQQADVLQLLSVPDRTSWLQYLDAEGLIASTDGGRLVGDDGRPEGLDNYVYFDHRNDDEYDSNAEDHDANDYPDDDDDDDASDDSSACGDGVGWGYQRRHDDGDGDDHYYGHCDDDEEYFA